MQNSSMTIDYLIQKLELQPLAGEGGLYHESYRSPGVIPGTALPGRYAQQERPYGTAIFYLLSADSDSFSAFHKLKTDEIYHFYLGDPVEMTLLYPDGSSRQVVLGQDLFNDQQVQVVVPSEVWQGSRLAAGGQFALLGTTMAPGFDPSDYEAGQRAELLAHYPQERGRILGLTRS